jgi:hypothetical protein
MSPTILRIIGIVFMVMAAVIAVLNLKRVADLGAFFLPAILIVIGLAFILRARNRRL